MDQQNSDKFRSGTSLNVGILAYEFYIPTLFVEQSALEAFDNVSSGKYTIGLGQHRMAVCSDYEDICSLCLTVTKRLLVKYQVDPRSIGRLDVGTETLFDKSKSIKTVLMQLFSPCDNTDIEGVDNMNACYGGTAAIFNAIHWIESSFWDGRYAMVVMGDIAVYAKGSARPTGGAGACALLIGPNAPLVFEPGLRGSHMDHTYDFYKPNFNSSYPVVDGQLSVNCYLSALDKCYQRYLKRDLAHGFSEQSKNTHSGIDLSKFDAVLFHTPYAKLSQKSLARLYLNDIARNCSYIHPDVKEKYKDIELSSSFDNKDIERDLVKDSNELYMQKTFHGLYFSKNIGNMYTPSLYYNLLSYLGKESETCDLAGKRILLFSYGSGLASSMFSIVCRERSNENFSLHKIWRCALEARMILDEKRHEITPELMDKLLLEREKNANNVPFSPSHPKEILKDGYTYLKSIDKSHRRFYEEYRSFEAETSLPLIQHLYKQYFSSQEQNSHPS